MPISVPDEPKVKTKVYYEFRGVDYTNDSTNVWYRRSPSGVNMLPDKSGRPFKRKGWEIAITNETLCDELSVSSCEITKCCWFTLKGCPHIVIFTDCGVLFYRINEEGAGEFTCTDVDIDCYSSYDRAFYFEGNGISAFYIYGHNKIWRYGEDFNLELMSYDFENNTGIYIPTILYSATADCTGEELESLNLLGSCASVLYREMSLNYAWGNDHVLFTYANETILPGDNNGEYDLALDGTDWTVAHNGTETTVSDISEYGLTIDSAEEGANIIILKGVYVMLPNNVSQEQLDDVDVRVTLATQFDKPLEVVDETTTPTTDQVSLHTDYVTDKYAWLEFGNDWSIQDASEDYLKVTFPNRNVFTTHYDDYDEASPVLTGVATLVE